MQDSKHGWDTRAWLVGILGGILGGSVLACASYPPLIKQINAATHHADAAYWIRVVTGLLSILVLPGVVSGIARRRTFLWGLLPLTLFLAADDLKDRFLLHGPRQVAMTLWVSLLVIGICLIISSGPVSLIRYLRVRAQHRREAALASLVAQREAAMVPQESVWPPPPDYRASD